MLGEQLLPMARKWLVASDILAGAPQPGAGGGGVDGRSQEAQFSDGIVLWGLQVTWLLCPLG